MLPTSKQPKTSLLCRRGRATYPGASLAERVGARAAGALGAGPSHHGTELAAACTQPWDGLGFPDTEIKAWQGLCIYTHTSTPLCVAPTLEFQYGTRAL